MEGRPLDDDSALVRRAVQGDPIAYGQLVRRYQDLAVRVAWLAGAGDDSQDAAQEGFVKAYRSLNRFRESAPFRPWLLAIVANEARNRRRSARRRDALVLRAGGGGTDSDAAPSPEDVALAGEQHGRLLTALALLDERDRQVIGCRYLEELSEAETAAVLGVRPGTVKSRLSRALNRLEIAMGARD